MTIDSVAQYHNTSFIFYCYAIISFNAEDGAPDSSN